jgi:uncharacterized protein (TIGR02145 family)
MMKDAINMVNRLQNFPFSTFHFQLLLFLAFTGRKRWHWSNEVNVTSLVITKMQRSGAYTGNANAGSCNTNSNGNYWSSTENSGDNAYNLNFNSSNTNPQNNNNKNNGFALRCVR